jgi:DNA-binding response OmpR family regulator
LRLRLRAVDTTSLKTILVCEDDESLRELIRASLGAGFRVHEAADYDTALALTDSNPPDLVLLDLVLEGRSGFDVLTALRGDPRTSETPVLVISASNDVDAHALAAGADRFLAKPFDPDTLRSIALEMLDER